MKMKSLMSMIIRFEKPPLTTKNEKTQPERKVKKQASEPVCTRRYLK